MLKTALHFADDSAGAGSNIDLWVANGMTDFQYIIARAVAEDADNKWSIAINILWNTNATVAYVSN